MLKKLYRLLTRRRDPETAQKEYFLHKQVILREEFI